MSSATVDCSRASAIPKHDEPGLFRIPKAAHTLAGFRRWVLSNEVPEKLPVTFLKGEVYVEMSKEEIFYHAAVKTAVAGAMFNLNQEADFGNLFINGVLVTNKRASVSNNPDMVAVFWPSLEKGLCTYVTRGKRGVEIVGSPDWLLEIVSDSSVFKDTQQLRRAYHEARVREYWIIDARNDDVSFQVLAWRKSGYAGVPQHDGWVRSRIFGARSVSRGRATGVARRNTLWSTDRIITHPARSRSS